MGKNIGKNIRKKLSIVRKILSMPNNLLLIHLKLMQKRAIQKTAEAPGDLLIRKSLRRLQTSQEVYHRIV